MPFGYYCMSTRLSMSAYIGSHRPSIPSRNKPLHPSVVPPPVDFSCLFSCPKGTTGNLSRLCDTPPSRPCHMDSGMELLSTRLAQLVVARTVSTTQTFPSRDTAALISSIDMLSGRMAQLPPTSPGLAEARSRKRVLHPTSEKRELLASHEAAVSHDGPVVCMAFDRHRSAESCRALASAYRALGSHQDSNGHVDQRGAVKVPGSHPHPFCEIVPSSSTRSAAPPGSLTALRFQCRSFHFTTINLISARQP